MFSNVRGRSVLIIFTNVLILFPLFGCGHYWHKKNTKNVENSAVLDNKKTHCSQINIFFENEEIEDLFFNNLLKKSIIDKIETSGDKKMNNSVPTNNTFGGGTIEHNVNSNCILSINIRKSYMDSMINGDGSIAGKNVRYYVSYTLSESENTLKNENFFIFYNIDISKYQYSNKVLFEKEDKYNVDKISRKIFWGIKRFLNR
jgi:hypothetical protein